MGHQRPETLGDAVRAVKLGAENRLFFWNSAPVISNVMEKKPDLRNCFEEFWTRISKPLEKIMDRLEERSEKPQVDKRLEERLSRPQNYDSRGNKPPVNHYRNNDTQEGRYGAKSSAAPPYSGETHTRGHPLVMLSRIEMIVAMSGALVVVRTVVSANSRCSKMKLTIKLRTILRMR